MPANAKRIRRSGGLREIGGLRGAIDREAASAVLFAARTLGHPVLLYDGSFQDWSRHPEYPVDNPAEVAGR